MADCMVRGIPDTPDNDQHKALRVKAAEKGLSVNKAIIEAIELYVGKQCPLYTDYKKSCQALKDHEYEKKTGLQARPIAGYR